MNGAAAGYSIIVATVLGLLGNMISPMGSDGASIQSVTRATCAHYVSAILERVEFAYDLGAFIYDELVVCTSRSSGKERDQESQLDYFGARYYASSLGRFSSPDPSGLVFADPMNSQSLNLYAYVQNNPLVGTDPTWMAYCQWNDNGVISRDDSANTGVAVPGRLE